MILKFKKTKHTFAGVTLQIGCQNRLWPGVYRPYIRFNDEEFRINQSVKILSRCLLVFYITDMYFFQKCLYFYINFAVWKYGDSL